VYFGTAGIVLYKSCDVKIVQDAGGVHVSGGKENGGVCGKNGYIHSSCYNAIHMLLFVGY